MQRKTHGLLGLGLLLAIFLGMMALMRITASQVAQLSGGQEIIDLTFGITPSKISTALSHYGRTAAAFYQWGFYAVDMVYAFAYGTFYRCAIRSIVERCGFGGSTGDMLPMLPVAAVTADLLENTMMFFLLAGSRSGVLMWAFTVFNVIKFTAVYSSLAIVLVGGLYCGVSAKDLKNDLREANMTDNGRVSTAKDKDTVFADLSSVDTDENGSEKK